MDFIETTIPGVKLIKPFSHKDERGTFVKPFQIIDFNKNGIDFTLSESFYSISGKNVFRGMHFQIPPFEHSKIVYCTSGKVLDILLDIRIGSPSYGKFESFELSAENNLQLYIPIGIAHGFISLEDESNLCYLTSKENHKDYDRGVHYNSFGFPFKENNLIISERDKYHPEPKGLHQSLLFYLKLRCLVS